jgi:hypothetical protein
MNTCCIRPIHLAALALLSSFMLSPSSLFGQGSLTPPGAPAPTMKTLTQVEPRTPISTAPFTISAPGSYYLTTNLAVASSTAIIIATNGVTLDLAGFTISSTDPSPTAYGILIRSGLGNLTIVNGFIQGGVTNNAGTYDGPGFKYGLYYAYSGTTSWNTRVAGVSVCGCQLYGIYLGRGESTVVESCTVRTVGGSGIAASTIKNSVAVDCGSTAISGDQVSDSRGECTGDGTGLYALTAQNCSGTSAGGYGLYAYMALNCSGTSAGGYGLNAYTALNCYGSSQDNQGLYAAHTAQNCYGYSVSGTGLYSVHTAQNCYGYSTNGVGLVAGTAQNCYGEASRFGGLRADTALNCYGRSYSDTGLFAAYTAQNCRGDSHFGPGLSADSAQNCHGTSSAGPVGLSARTASFCCGNRPSGTAIDAFIATGCYAAAGTNNVTHKYNMP